MRRFEFQRFFALTDDERSYDIFSSPTRRLRYIPSTRVVTVTSKWAHNLPGLAHEYLGDTGLWWTILMHNGLTDPLRDVVPGITLKIPERNTLLALLETRRTGDASNTQTRFTRV